MFGRFLGGEPPGIEVLPSPRIWNYRNKVHLRVRDFGDGPTWAYHRPGRRDEFVPVESCALLADRLNRLLAELPAALGKTKMGTIEELIARDSSRESRSVAALVVKGRREADGLAEALRGIDPATAGIVIHTRDRAVPGGIRARGRSYLREAAGGAVLAAGPLSFFQVNLPLLEEVIKAVRGFVRERKVNRLADLYSGVGVFGIALAGEVEEVLAVESGRSNFSFLKRNAALNRTGNLTARRGRSERLIGDVLAAEADLLLLDPPRAGVREELIAAVAEKPPPAIVYISCNPSTLLRDLKRLSPRYQIAKILLPDFFPHTPHIEACCFLKRG